MSLLSFGDEVEEDEVEMESKPKMKSAYYYSEDPQEKKTALEAERRKKEKGRSVKDEQDIQESQPPKSNETIQKVKEKLSKDKKRKFQPQYQQEEGE